MGGWVEALHKHTCLMHTYMKQVVTLRSYCHLDGKIEEIEKDEGSTAFKVHRSPFPPTHPI